MSEVSYVETIIDTEYQIKIVKQIEDGTVKYYLRSKGGLWTRVYVPSEPIVKIGKTTSELSPRQLIRARYGGPRGGSPQIGRS